MSTFNVNQDKHAGKYWCDFSCRWLGGFANKKNKAHPVMWCGLQAWGTRWFGFFDWRPDFNFCKVEKGMLVVKDGDERRTQDSKGESAHVKRKVPKASLSMRSISH